MTDLTMPSSRCVPLTRRSGKLPAGYELKCGLSQALLAASVTIEEFLMAALMIGELARQAGVAPSALRYYEKVGLLPSPARASRRRQYDRNVLGRIRIILLARDAGFSIRETRLFLNGIPAAATPGSRWREMAARKIAELDELMARVRQMKLILNASFNCECRQLADCERLLAARNRCGSDLIPRQASATRAKLQPLRPRR
jgi:MerR family redox-sensitive transcriptional activator SoxR